MNKVVLFLILSFIVSSQSHALQCIEVFTKDGVVRSQVEAKSIEQVHSETRLLFYKMPVAQRIQVLDKMIEQAQAKITPEQGVLRRLWSKTAREQHATNLEAQMQLNELQRVREMYVWIQPLVSAVIRRGDFFREDEVQLLNRVIESEKLYESVKFLSQRFRDLADKKNHEKKFLDSVLYYLTWGPNADLFPVPFHHWVLFDILSARQNPILLDSLTQMLFKSGDNYRDSKSDNQNDAAESRVDDYWLMQQDPVFKLVEQTNPQAIDDLMTKAIDNGALDYDAQAQQLRLTSR